MRRRASVLVVHLVFGLAFGLLFGCSASTEGKGSSTTLGPDAGASTDAGDGLGGDGGLGDAAFDVSDDAAVEPPTGPAAVYGHSATTLYKVDPEALDAIELGPFQAESGGSINDMTDIALDKDGVMYGVTFGALYRIDYAAKPPSCKRLATLGTQFNGLTMIPAGMLDPDEEVLVGVANDGGWWRVDVAAGASSATLTKLGSYGGGHVSSGDAVGIIGDAVYATTKLGGFGNDHVVTVDPKTGKVTKDLGTLPVSDLYGVGYWGGILYGFADNGRLYQVDLKTMSLKEVALKAKPSSWWGAGVTTKAPVVIK